MKKKQSPQFNRSAKLILWSQTYLYSCRVSLNDQIQIGSSVS